MVIPPYPLSQPLDFSHKDHLDSLFLSSPPEISEFTFTNLFIWRNANEFHVSDLNGFVVMESRRQRDRIFFPPIGAGDMKWCVSKIIKDTGGKFIRVPDSVAAFFLNDLQYIVSQDRANADYLYETEALLNLSGKRYDGKRNLIRKAKSAISYEYVKIDSRNAKSCLEFEERWCMIKGCDLSPGLSNERIALAEIVAHYSDLSLFGGMILSDGIVVAIAIGERLSNETLVMHILKAQKDIQGLYQLMLHEFLERHGSAFLYVNLEQDLGIEGLRKFKLSYHPLKLIDKYTIMPTGLAS